MKTELDELAYELYRLLSDGQSRRESSPMDTQQLAVERAVEEYESQAPYAGLEGEYVSPAEYRPHFQADELSRIYERDARRYGG